MVDDAPPNRALLRDMLAPLGFLVAEAADGEEALQLARREKPDLLLIDSVMPVLDGPAAIAQLRASPGLEQLVVVSISATATEAEEQRCLAAGADAFVAKPVELQGLLEAIGRLLRIEWRHAREETT